MLAMKCDRCGTIYEYYGNRKVLNDSEKANAVQLVIHDLRCIPYGGEVYDLCPGCMGRLEAFLKGGEKNV